LDTAASWQLRCLRWEQTGNPIGPDPAAPCGSATIPDGVDIEQQIYVATDERILTKKDGTKKTPDRSQTGPNPLKSHIKKNIRPWS
jgi:hypothetical protein